uniref:E3 ubiquitin-protein ligase UPL2-like n=1 Tax=Erigeron canadensis TaxID=72917 RepID=UPI001CB8EA7F|nr:E3 ubiquitin-protein ligase UPL2-like [Erigeron canadensis]
MAENRGSMLPSELRKLISEGHMGPKIKLDSDPPPKVKAFIDKVIEYPLEDLAIPLSEFHWEYNKGNFYHWRPLFLHFKTYFKTYLSSRKDLLLEDTLEDDTPFPKQSVLQILRVMQVILENCHNKSSFDGLEYFKLLLASTDPEVLIATLETLSALVKINPSKLHASGKQVGCGSSINDCLLSLAKLLGAKKDGLSLYSYIMMDEEPQIKLPSDIQTVQNLARASLSLTRDRANLQSMNVLHTVELDLTKVDDLSWTKLLIKQSNVPPEGRFSLLTRVRYANAFCSLKRRRQYSKVCLLAFMVLVQASDSHDELVSFFDSEPEYTNQLIKLVKSKKAVPGKIRTLAMHALGSQLAAYSSSDQRAQFLSGSRISFADENHMIFFEVLQEEISSLNKDDSDRSVAFVEALLQFYLLYVISASITERVIQGSRMIPTLLSFLRNSDPSHMHLVCLAVKTLQKLMDYSYSDVTLFNDLRGVDLLTDRLLIEVVQVIDSSDENLNIDSQKRLIRVLLKALGSATYAPANSTRPREGHDVSLPVTLSMIIANVNDFGGDVYSAAVTVMSEVIHKNPTCYASLDELGLPNAFLESVIAGVLPSSKALTCVPIGIAAICINPKGLEAVNKTSALGFLVDVLTDKKYVIPINDGIVPLADAVKELLRHVSSLMGTGMDVIIQIVNEVASIEDDKRKTGKVNEGNAMDMDTEGKENVVPCLFGSTIPGPEGICDEQFIQLCIFHVIVLLHRTMVNAETRRLFVEKEGIEALLKLVLRPSITQSSKGMSIALHSTLIFESFTQDHSARLARAFCSTLKEYLKSTLDNFGVRSGLFVLDAKATQHSEVFSSLFLVEFLLFLAASEDNRSVTALLQEFGNDSKGVLESIGKLHREILWQIAILEDFKSENEDDNDGSGSSDGSLYSETNTSESEKQRFDSFRKCLNQLLRRQMSGWSFESQFFDLITHTSGLPHHLGGNSHQSLPSGTSDGSSSDGPRKAEKRRSCYASCCNMMRSLSLHITELFQELGRRVDTMMVTPASKSVASTFAAIMFDHMNFKGHVKPFGSVASWSPKCRYLGKVVDFIDGILLEKPDTCNPVLLKCLYDSGVIQLVLTTFEATRELLFTVNRTPASPVETDEGTPKPYSEETVWSWIDGPLASYGKLMDHLVTSSFILSSFTKHFLAQPLVTRDNAFPRDVEVFGKARQSSILKAVLPVWSHPRFADCSDDFITTVISIVGHVFSGVEVRSLSNTGPHPAGLPSDVTTMSLGNSGTDVKDNIVTTECSQPIEEETVQLPPVDDLLSTCKKLLEMKDSLALPVGGLLLTICSQDDGRYRSNVILFVLEQLKLCSANSDGGKNNMLSSLFHVLPLKLNEDKDTLEVATKMGLVKVAADLLSDWNPCSHEDGTVLVPKWVTAAFLAIDRLAQVDQKLNADISELLKKFDGGDQNSGISSKHIDVDDRKRFIEISCGLLRKLLPAETIRAVLQLCSTLTRTHSVAVNFLNAGGLPLLLSLPTSSLSVGNVAATIIRHILEDPQTLQETSTDGQVTSGSITKLHETNTKNEKAHREPPQSFTTVIELLLESVTTFVPASEEKSATRENSSVMDMDIDVNFSKDKGKAIASGSDRNEESGQESSASLAKVVFVLELLKKILMMYGPSVDVLLQKDAEQSGIFHHVLFSFLPHLRSSKHEKKDADWRHKLAVRASQFLVASCVRSTEAIKRVLLEINNAFVDYCSGNRPPGSHIQAFVYLLGSVLAAQLPTDVSISREVSDTFKDVGLVTSLTQTFHILDLDHADSLKIVTGILEVLTTVAKELVHAEPSDQGQHGETENTGDISGSNESVSLPNASPAPTSDMSGDEVDEDEDEDEDGDNNGHNDLEDDDQGDEDDDGGVIFRLSEVMSGIDMLGHRSNNDHVMPVEVFGSSRQGQTDNAREGYLENNLEQLKSFLQSLRNGRHGQPQYVDMQFGSRDSGSLPTADEPQRVNAADAPVGQSQSVDMQLDQNDVVSRDVKSVPVIQESSGSVTTSRVQVEGSFDLKQGVDREALNISITASLLSEQQEKVLDVLPCSLVKEGHRWVEWFASQHNPTLVESSRRGEGNGSSMDRAVGITARRSGSKPVETNGDSLVDKEDLKAMIRLLYVDQQPQVTTRLQELLLKLCAHDKTCSSVVHLMMDLLMLEMRKSDISLSASNYRLYEFQHDVTYAHPQSFNGKAGQDYAAIYIASHSFLCMLSVPPLMSLRVLETLIYLAQRNRLVAKLLLQFRLPLLDSQSPKQSRGKAIMGIQDCEIEEQQKDQPAISMLLSLLRHPLYLRSIAHLEQLLNLLCVILDNPDDDSDTILLNLPLAELRHLSSLLARESLSDNVCALVAEVLKKLVTIAPCHCQLFIIELKFAMFKLTDSAIDELCRFSVIEKDITTTASVGAAILRVMQALSSLVTENDQTATLDLVADIYSELELLWTELSKCIGKIEIYTKTSHNVTDSSMVSSGPSGAMPPLPAGTQNIISYIESFFVVCEILYPLKSGVKQNFLEFLKKHKKLLNVFIRQNPGLLDSSFSVMLKFRSFIEFDNKRSHFKSKIKRQDDHHRSRLKISVARTDILGDSCSQLMEKSTHDLKGSLTIHFKGEEGIDAGGLTREWYQLLPRVIFDKRALLFTTFGNDAAFQPNPNSVEEPEHLVYFKFVGRVAGKALFDDQLLDVHFTRSFYKHILGAKVTYRDFKSIDPDYFKNLKLMLENDGCDNLFLTFSIEADEQKKILREKSEVTDYELIPGGRNMLVTDENKKEYVDLIAEYRLTTAIRPQIDAFLEGFYELISRDQISIFNVKELELLISGLPDIDLGDMKANTEYSGYSAESPVIQLFWEVVQDFSKEDKARLLQFVTGISKVPLEGFSALEGSSGVQKFQIHKTHVASDHLPSARTCFNQLILPEYPSKEHLKERLLLAIRKANEGFGFG